MDLNKVMLIGRLTADPELRTIPNGQSVATFGLATNRRWTDRDGQKQQSVEFHNIVVWGRQAETTSQFLKKGAMAYIEGRLQTRSWDGQDGQKRRTTEIVAERVQFGPRAMNPGGGGSPSFVPPSGSSASTVSPPGGAPGPQVAPSSSSSSSGPARSGGADAGDVSSPVEEELPQIDIDENEIKPENVPF